MKVNLNNLDNSELEEEHLILRTQMDSLDETIEILRSLCKEKKNKCEFIGKLIDSRPYS